MNQLINIRDLQEWIDAEIDDYLVKYHVKNPNMRGHLDSYAEGYTDALNKVDCYLVELQNIAMNNMKRAL